MSSLNKVVLLGRLGRDPEFRMMSSEKELCSFSVATTESWKDKNTGERMEKADWHNIVIFNENIAQIAKKFLHKGSRVYIEGSLKTRKWQDNTGQDRYITEVVLSNFNAVLLLMDDNRGKTSSTEDSLFEPEKVEVEKHVEESEELDDAIPF